MELGGDEKVLGLVKAAAVIIPKPSSPCINNSDPDTKQALSVAEAAKRGIGRARKNGLKTPITIAVLMVERLDDYLRDVAQDQQADVSESDSLKGPFETEIDKPVDEAVIRRLSMLAEFRKAYEEDGMQVEEFSTYGSSNRTIDQFINDGWNPLASMKRQYETQPV